VANVRSNNVSVLLGNGDGSFRAGGNYATGRGPESVAVGDFNGDGVPDLAVGNDASNNVSVLLGHGDGTFPATASYAVGPNPQYVAVADLNGDGTPDLAVVNYVINVFGDATISVLLGNGNGSFQPAQSYAAYRYATAAAVGDFNGDGIPDLVTANAPGFPQDSSVVVLLGNGDGTFRSGVRYLTGFSPYAVAEGGFTAHRHLDSARAT